MTPPDPTDPGSGVARVVEGEVTRRIPDPRRWHWSDRIFVMGRVRPRDPDMATPAPGLRVTLVLIRVVWRVGRGYRVLAERSIDAASHGRIRRQIRAAEAAGDAEALGVWIDRHLAAKKQRHDRVAALPVVLASVAVTTGAGIGLGAAGLVAGGIVVAIFHPLGWTWGGYWHAIGTLIDWAITAGAVAVFAVPVAVTAWAWREGRLAGPMPGWALAPAEREEAHSIVTAAGLAEALAHLNIGPLNKAIAQGWQVQFSVPPVRVGNRGYQVVFSLPLGVEPQMLADKKPVLARNLYRHPTEVWPAEAEPGWVDLWVADPGASKRPAPEYPMLHDGVADVFEGVPVGVTQRGDPLLFPLVGANFSAGGRMGQGKSNLCRVVMLGAALDPLARLRVHVFANNGDFDAYEPRLEVYNRGTSDEVTRAGLEELRWLYEETGRREDRIREVGAKKVTRGVAEKHPDLAPLIVLFSECHELFGCTDKLDPDGPKSETVGKAATELATKTLRRARKTGVVLGFDTQQVRVDAIPPKIIGLVGINACFSVKSWRDNDGFLGDGSFAAGIRATELRFNVDVGTCLVTGATAEVFEIVKTHFVEVDDEASFDAATEVIERAMGNVHPAVAGQLGVAPPTPPGPRDLLADLDQALGADVLPSADVPALLRGLAPDEYRGLTGVQLREQLADLGVKVPSTGNRWPLDPAVVREVLARRDDE